MIPRARLIGKATVLGLAFDDNRTRQLLRALEELPRRVAFKHMRIALNAWGGVVRDVAKTHVREETGLLKKSLSVKVIIPPASFNVAHHDRPSRVLVGPRRKSGRMMRKTARGRLVGLGAAQRLLKAERARLAAAGVRPLEREKAAVKAVLEAMPAAVYRNPTRYAHLVEKGTKRSKAYPFLAPAILAGETAALEKLRHKLAEGVAAEATALRRR